MGTSARLRPTYALVFFLLVLLFVLLGLLHIDRSCLDAADSTYLISADGISRGLMPYRDFLLAHPPLLFLLGAPLAALKAGVLPFRIFSILVAAGVGLAVWRLALRLTANQSLALLAAALALFAPLGVFFSKLFLNDSLVSLLAAGMVLLLLSGSRRSTAAAGVLAVLGMLTKLTFVPVLVVAVVYLLIYRRGRLRLFLAVALGGTVLTALALEALTGGAYLGDILGAQASKGYSFTNFYEGLHRIWQMDWPLLVPAVPGLYFMGREWRRARGEPRGRLFLVLGWLAAGVTLLATLPAEGHDTNLFQVAEPAVALLAAWGITGLAASNRFLAVAAAAWVVVAASFVAVKDRSFLARSNAEFVQGVVAHIEDATPGGEAILAPGCYALEADRPVVYNFFDRFLWEEKYKRADPGAVNLYNGMWVELAVQGIPAVVLEEDTPTFVLLRDHLDSYYTKTASSPSQPPVALWLPNKTAPQPCG